MPSETLKTDKLNIRPVFHRNESQTRGHVFICMFAYAIVKEIETLIYPWLKQYNTNNNCKHGLSIKTSKYMIYSTLEKHKR